MHLLQSFVWTSIPLLSLNVVASALEHQHKARDALANEQSQNWFQRLALFKRQAPVFCNPSDPYYQMVQSHSAGSDYCASVQSSTSTVVVYVTPTT